MSVNRLLAAIAVASVALSATAHAAVIATVTPNVLTDHYVGPSGVSGNVLLKQTGTKSNVYMSPFADKTSPFVAVGAGGIATYSFGLTNVLSLVWGSADAYNRVTFFDGNTEVGLINGGTIIKLGGRGTLDVTLASSEAFNRVEFSSGANSFEFSNASVGEVPLPASAPMFGAALLALGAVGYGVKRKKAAAAA